MIIFTIDVLPGDVSEEIVWEKQGTNTYGPTSNLINKFRDAFLLAVKNKEIDTTNHTSITFCTTDGFWSIGDYTVQTKELVAGRWATIDRAMRMGQVYARRAGKPLLVSDIVKVKIEVPE